MSTWTVIDVNAGVPSILGSGWPTRERAIKGMVQQYVERGVEDQADWLEHYLKIGVVERTDYDHATCFEGQEWSAMVIEDTADEDRSIEDNAARNERGVEDQADWLAPNEE